MSSYLGRVTQLWKGRTSAPERKGPSPSLFHPKSLGKWGDRGGGVEVLPGHTQQDPEDKRQKDNRLSWLPCRLSSLRQATSPL